MSELTTADEMVYTDGALIAGRDESSPGTVKAILSNLALYARNKTFGSMVGQAGKVPVVNEDEDGFEWGEGGGGGGLPSFVGNEGRFLAVNDTATAAEWSDPPAGSGQTATSGATVAVSDEVVVTAEEPKTIEFDTEVYDNGGYWSSGQPTRLTATFSGWYAANAFVNATTPNNDIIVATIIKNGDDIILSAVDMGTNPIVQINMSAVFHLEAGDYIELTVYTDEPGLGVVANMSMATFGDGLPDITDNEEKFLRVKEDGSGVEWVSPSSVEGVPEAPEDGKVYGRKDAAWLDLVGQETTTIQIMATDPNADDPLFNQSGVAYFRVPSTLNGRSLVAVAAAVITASSSGAVVVQIYNATDAANVLSTPLSIDQGENDSATAATPAVINPAQAVVQTGDMLRVDVTAAGAGTKGLIVELQFKVEA